MAAEQLQLRKGTEPYPGYRLVNFIGRGGFGEVWSAERAADGKQFAIKFLGGSLWSDSQIVTAQEIRALQAIRQIKHAHILQMEQVWCCPGFVAILMELAEGNLLDVLNASFEEFGTPLHPQYICFFLTQAAAGLDFLNARRHLIDGQRFALRHCDVKPSNLLVLGKTVKVADFSLAVPTVATLTTHRRGGTLAYAAPEVFQARLTDRSDQYSLAVTYYQLRTNRLPYPIPETFTGRVQRQPPDLSLLAKGEREAVARALDPVPQNRWSTCAELMDELTRYAAKTERGSGIFCTVSV